MDGDELMRSSPRTSMKGVDSDSTRPAVVTPPDRRVSGGAPPPVNAFVHMSPNDRWAQYERDSQLEKEAARAHADAVATAAERAAAASELTSSRAHPYSDLPPRDRVRAEALSVLERADDQISPFALRQTRSGGLTTGSDEPYSFKKSASTGIHPRNPDEPFSFRRSSSSNISTGSDSSRRRTPAALAGLDLKSATQSRTDSRRLSFHDDDLVLEDEEDLVEIVDTENRITGSRSSTGGPYRDDPKSGQYEDYPSGGGPPSPWSSRYSVDQYLAGGATTKEVLNRIDKEQQRLAKSARNLFMASPDHYPTKETPTNIFGSGFTFRRNSSMPHDTNLRTIWSDNDPLTSDGCSLSPPFHPGSNALSKSRRRRRRTCLLAFLAVGVVVIIAASVKTAKNRRPAPISYGNSNGQPTTFYVMADVPYDANEETKLSRDLEGLPGDAAFVIHLGNIQDASVTLCPEYAYEDASEILQTSPVPVFMLPGEHDWNNCPEPAKAWDLWNNSFLKFERNFEPDWYILRQSEELENFSFLYNGVLFIGFHLVGGRIHDQDEWKSRHAKNVDWLGENINTIFARYSFRAVILMGNARPSSQHRAFFNEVLSEIRSLGKPAVYIHASSIKGSKFMEYKPYNDVGNLQAIQLEDGGLSPPLRVSVDFGPNPFIVG